MLNSFFRLGQVLVLLTTIAALILGGAMALDIAYATAGPRGMTKLQLNAVYHGLPGYRLFCNYASAGRTNALAGYLANRLPDTRLTNVVTAYNEALDVNDPRRVTVQDNLILITSTNGLGGSVKLCFTSPNKDWGVMGFGIAPTPKNTTFSLPSGFIPLAPAGNSRYYLDLRVMDLGGTQAGIALVPGTYAWAYALRPRLPAVPLKITEAVVTATAGITTAVVIQTPPGQTFGSLGSGGVVRVVMYGPGSPITVSRKIRDLVGIAALVPAGNVPAPAPLPALLPPPPTPAGP